MTGDICEVAGCSSISDKSSKMCSSCRHRKQRYGDPTFSPRKKYDSCLVDGCTRTLNCRGYCRRHYNSLKKYGDPKMVDTREQNKGVKCSVCGTMLLRDATSKRCRECVLLAEKKSKVKKAYGPEGLALLEKILAGAGCDICGHVPEPGKRRLHIDHCHRTGKVRGILCHPCNVSLGLLEENTDRMFDLISYVLTAEGIMPTPEELKVSSGETLTFSQFDVDFSDALEEHMENLKK